MSRNIKFWKQIYSTIISNADMIMEVLDARNPIGTRIVPFEEFVHKNAPSKEIILVLNKIDLIPKRILDEWIKYFKEVTPYRIFSVSAKYNRGIIYFKRKLNKYIQVPHTRIVIVGYPNTGKSSLINALVKERKYVGVSSRAGFTRSVMEIKVSEKIFIYDTPGVIPITEGDETSLAIKSVINPEQINDLESVAYNIIRIYVGVSNILKFFKIDAEFIKKVLGEKDAEEFIKMYISTIGEGNGAEGTFGKIRLAPMDSKGGQLKEGKIKEGKIKEGKIKEEKIKDRSQRFEEISMEDFYKLIRLIGFKRGLLVKGGVVNENAVYKLIIHLWQKNKIKFYVLPPTLSMGE